MAKNFGFDLGPVAFSADKLRSTWNQTKGEKCRWFSTCCKRGRRAGGADPSGGEYRIWEPTSDDPTPVIGTKRRTKTSAPNPKRMARDGSIPPMINDISDTMLSFNSMEEQQSLADTVKKYSQHQRTKEPAGLTNDEPMMDVDHRTGPKNTDIPISASVKAAVSIEKQHLSEANVLVHHLTGAPGNMVITQAANLPNIDKSTTILPPFPLAVSRNLSGMNKFTCADGELTRLGKDRSKDPNHNGPITANPLEGTDLFSSVIGATITKSSPNGDKTQRRITPTEVGFCGTDLRELLPTLGRADFSAANGMRYFAEVGKMAEFWSTVTAKANYSAPIDAGESKYQLPQIGVDEEIELMTESYAGIPLCTAGQLCNMLNLPIEVEGFEPYVGKSFATPAQLKLIQLGIMPGNQVKPGLCYMCVCVTIKTCIIQSSIKSQSMSCNVEAVSDIPQAGSDSADRYNVLMPFSTLVSTPGGFSQKAIMYYQGLPGHLAEPFRNVSFTQFEPAFKEMIITPHAQAPPGSSEKTVKLRTFAPLAELIYDPANPIQPYVSHRIGSKSQTTVDPSSYSEIKDQFSRYMVTHLLRKHFANERHVAVPTATQMQGNPKAVFKFLSTDGFGGRRQRGVHVRTESLCEYTSMVKAQIGRSSGDVLMGARPFDYLFSDDIRTTAENLEVLSDFLGFVKRDYEAYGEDLAVVYPHWRLSSLEVFEHSELTGPYRIYHALHCRINAAWSIYQIVSNRYKGQPRKALLEYLTEFMRGHQDLSNFFMRNGDPEFRMVPDGVLEMRSTHILKPVCLDTRGYYLAHDWRKLVEILNPSFNPIVYPDDLHLLPEIPWKKCPQSSPSERLRRFMRGSTRTPKSYDMKSRGMDARSFPMLALLSRIFSLSVDEFSQYLFGDFDTMRRYVTRGACPEAGIFCLRDPSACMIAQVFEHIVSALDGCEYWFPFPQQVKHEPYLAGLDNCGVSSIVLTLLVRINCTYSMMAYLSDTAGRIVSEEAQERFGPEFLQELENIKFDLYLFAQTHLSLVVELYRLEVFDDARILYDQHPSPVHNILKRGTCILEYYYPHENNYIDYRDIPDPANSQPLAETILAGQFAKIVKLNWPDICSAVLPSSRKHPEPAKCIFPPNEITDEELSLLRKLLFISIAGLYPSSDNYLTIDQLCELSTHTWLGEVTQEQFRIFLQGHTMLMKNILSEWHIFSIGNSQPFVDNVFSEQFPDWDIFKTQCLNLARATRRLYSQRSLDNLNAPENLSGGYRPALKKLGTFQALEDLVASGYPRREFITKLPTNNFLRFMMLVIQCLEKKLNKEAITYIGTLSSDSVKLMQKTPAVQVSTRRRLLALTSRRLSMFEQDTVLSYVKATIPGDDIRVSDFIQLKYPDGKSVLDFHSAATLIKCHQQYRSDKCTQSIIENLVEQIVPEYYDSFCFVIWALWMHNSTRIIPCSFEMSVNQSKAVWNHFNSKMESGRSEVVPYTAHLLIRAYCCDTIKTHRVAPPGPVQKVNGKARDSGQSASAPQKIGAGQVAIDTQSGVQFCARKVYKVRSNPNLVTIPKSLALSPQVSDYISTLTGQSELWHTAVLSVRSANNMVFATTHGTFRTRHSGQCGGAPVARFSQIGYIITCESVREKSETVQHLTICPKCGKTTVYSLSMYSLQGFACYACNLAINSKLESPKCILCGVYKQKPQSNVSIWDTDSNAPISGPLCHKCSRVYEQVVAPHPESAHQSVGFEHVLTREHMKIIRTRELVTTDESLSGLYKYFVDYQTRKPAGRSCTTTIINNLGS